MTFQPFQLQFFSPASFEEILGPKETYTRHSEVERIHTISPQTIKVAPCTRAITKFKDIPFDVHKLLEMLLAKNANDILRFLFEKTGGCTKEEPIIFVCQGSMRNGQIPVVTFELENSQPSLGVLFPDEIPYYKNVFQIFYKS